MIRLIFRKVKGKEYCYLEESIRIGDKVMKISKYLGNKNKIKKEDIEKNKAEFEKEIIEKKSDIKVSFLKEIINKLEYPLNWDGAKTIEEMNFKYKEIIKKLHPKDFDDLNKRFIANYVFESNALEGNSLTLKNVSEIVFESRISKGKDLREIYDAQNSYNAFLYLQKKREKISHDFIIDLHSKIMDKIDSRTGYRKVPAEIIGKPNTKLAKPEEIQNQMDNLIKWYEKNENFIYPLELAFKFHHRFEKIHPFCDGNGRVGRFLLNYILLNKGYFPIIIRKNQRERYLRSLDAADNDNFILLIRFAVKYYKITFRKFFDVYFKYL